MSAKAYRRCYAAIMAVLAVIAVGFGLLCYRYDRLAEGCIIIGASLVIATVTMILHVTQANAERELVLAKSGADIVELGCICHVDDKNGEDCIMYLRKNGVVIDTKDVSFCLVKYNEIRLISYDNANIRLQYRNEVGELHELKFVCNKPLRVKAAVQIFLSHGCDCVTFS